MTHNRQSSTQLFIALLLILSLFSTSCIMTYRDFPVDMIDHPPHNTNPGTLYYQFQREPWFDPGFKGLVAVFKDKTPFSTTERVEKMPPKGVYCLVTTKWEQVSGAAAGFGYIAYVFSFIVPVWSLREGHTITYQLYVDGQQVNTYKYRVTRKFFAWLGLLPFLWVNYLTYDQDEAFAATAYQFFHDAEAVFQRSNR